MGLSLSGEGLARKGLRSLKDEVTLPPDAFRLKLHISPSLGLRSAVGPAEFTLASPYSCTSQFLHINLYLSIYPSIPLVPFLWRILTTTVTGYSLQKTCLVWSAEPEREVCVWSQHRMLLCFLDQRAGPSSAHPPEGSQRPGLCISACGQGSGSSTISPGEHLSHDAL